MDLNLSADQRDLRAGLRDVLADLWSDERLRAAIGADSGAPDDSGTDAVSVGSGGASLEGSGRCSTLGDDGKAWRQLADVGVLGVCAPEAVGGLGLGLADAAVLFEELGAALVPGPLVSTVLAAGLLAGRLPGLVHGETVATVLDLRDGVPLVEHLGSATHLILLDDSGLRLADASAVVAQPMERPLDPLTPVWSIDPSLDLDDLGAPVGGPEEAAEWIRRATVLGAAVQVGVARGAVDRAVRYAKERQQFDRVIGSFQAVKHLLAEALVRTDLARAAVLVAALCVDDPESGDRDAEISAAKILADEAATLNGRCGIQVHGGMGFTWEVLAHLHLKRAWLLEASYGSGDVHAARLAARL